MVVAADLKLTPEDTLAKVGAIARSTNLARTEWQVEITPTAGMDTKVELSDVGKVKFSGTATATVPVKGAPPSGAPAVIESVDATYAPATATTMATTTITETDMLAANGFAVIGAGALPDIQRFFAEGWFNLGIEQRNGCRSEICGHQ